MRRRAERALAELGAAAPLGAVCLLAANDHQFKRLFHNALTGKLSDVAICFLLPLLVSAVLGLVCGWPGRRRLAVGAVVATLVFTLLELSDTAGALFVHATGALGLGSGPLTRDPTDLLALASVPLAVAYGRRRLAVAELGPNVWRSATGALVMATGMLALLADSDNRLQVRHIPVPTVTFQAEGGCGPGGLIVVGSSNCDLPRFEISNAAAVGLPTFFASDICTWSVGALKGRGPPDGGVQCPTTSDFDHGGWNITVERCLSPGGGVATAPECAGCQWMTVETCSAVLADGEGSLTCRSGYGGTPCVSHLTVVGDGGTDGPFDGRGGLADAGASDLAMDGAATDEEVADGSSEQAVDGSSDVD